MGTLFSIGLKVISNIVGRNIYFMTLNTGSYTRHCNKDNNPNKENNQQEDQQG